MQKPCSGLLLNAQGRLLAAGSDGCCYVLDAESLQQNSRLILHPSQTGKPLLLWEHWELMYSDIASTEHTGWLCTLLSCQGLSSLHYQERDSSNHD